MLKSSAPDSLNFEATRQTLRGISIDELRDFGVNHIAYIKPSLAAGHHVYTICNADGTPLVALDSLERAFHVARQNDLEPVILQ